MAEPARPLTVAVPTFQRREAVLALLEALRPQLEGAAGVDVVVVVDGSTDGTAEAVGALAYPVPLSAVVQPNRGLAAARNRALSEGAGEVVWFLDDDMRPADGLLARHRRAHEAGPACLLMGPCPPPPDLPVIPLVRAWAEEQYAALEHAGRLEHAVHFLAANTSGPRELWEAAGGFDERFVGWGAEDHEMGLRLLAAGIEVRYDPHAVAWHHQRRGVAGFCATKLDEGRNTVRLARKYPGTEAELLPARTPGPSTSVLRLLARGGPRALAVAARAAASAAAVAARVAPRRAGGLVHDAGTLGFVAGVADQDAGEGYLSRLLGAPERASRRDSDQPSSTPTGSQ